MSATIASGRLEPERRRVADVELEDLVALGLQPLGLDQDRASNVVPDVLELAALDDRTHGRSLAESRPADPDSRGTMSGPGRVPPSHPRTRMRDISYPPVIVTAKVLFRALGLRFQLAGTEHVPREGGALLAFNHVSYIDFVLAGFAAQPVAPAGPVHGQARGLRPRVSGPVMRSMHHISVDRADGIGLDRGGAALPPGGRGWSGSSPRPPSPAPSRSRSSSPGATRIAAEAGVPLIPVVLWGTQRLMTKDHPRDFSRGKTIGIHVGEPMHGDPRQGRRADRRAARAG